MATVFGKRFQLQWIVLLTVAVLLPTVSLLWFMSRVIANERLVVRQKLTALYQDKLIEAGADTGMGLTNLLTGLETPLSSAAPYSAFRDVVLEAGFEGLVIWDTNGSLRYPTTAEGFSVDMISDHPLAPAWNAEFGESRCADAAHLYGLFTAHQDPSVAIAALAGQSRCWSKLGDIDKAIAVGREAAFFPSSTPMSAPHRRALENARLFLLSLLARTERAERDPDLFNQTVNALIRHLYDAEAESPRGASQNLFTGRKVLAAIASTSAFDPPEAARQLETLVAAEALSISAAELIQAADDLPRTVFPITLDDRQLYGLEHRTKDTSLLLLTRERLESMLAGYRDAFTGSECVYRVLDASGVFAAGTPNPVGQPFTRSPLPQGFPGWEVELYFQGDDVFEKAAKRQIAVYSWSGFLVILVILAAAAFTTRAVGRQMRLNQLKNDFIATVSHELKTPLASMRVLVDTLLEGHVKDEAQVIRYLQLTANENERLSRMIDNFLSFSRMERNKNAFTLTDSIPAEIARDAAAAMQTKFDARGCRFDTTIEDGLPEVVADHDALVTVLVNLLDNACKYTGNEKRISLHVFRRNNSIRFSVTDNGVGLSQKQIRRIFDRFYQVDSSLARRAEGCGLGLSIVNFIVKAHGGKITVESKPGRGSKFTVHLPVGHGHYDETPLQSA